MGDASEGDRTEDEASHGFLWWWTVPELLAVAALLALVVGGLLGRTTFLTGVSRPLRIAAAAFLTVELLIPLWVYRDLRRRPDADAFWVHVAAMPGINLFGLFGYLQHRKLDDDG